MTKKELPTLKTLAVVLTAALLLSCFFSGTSNFAYAQTVSTQSRGSAEAILDLIGNVSTHGDWNSTYQIIYDGITLGQTTITELQNSIDAININSSSTAETAFYWYYQLSKLGACINSTTIKNALNTMPMLPNVGCLPFNYLNSGTPSFLINNRYILYAYQWASQLDYETEKWNLTSAYNCFNNTVNSYGKPILCVGSDGKGWGIINGPRFYDECAQTIDMYLTFWLLGIEDGLKQAQFWWNWTNEHLWTNSISGQGYYKYSVGTNDFECEAGSFDQIIWKLYAYDQSTKNIANLFVDLETRALIDGWSSPQWGDFVVTHATSNPQQRLENTIISWAALLGLYGNMTLTMRNQVQSMLNGTAGPAPAWNLTLRSQLFDSATGMFRMRSDGPISAEATADAAVLLMLLSNVPVTGSLAVPVMDSVYQDLNGIIDGASFNMDLASRTVTISVSNPGTFLSMFGTNIFQYNIDAPGIWQLTFSSDWNSLTSKTQLSELPISRLYFGGANYSEIYSASSGYSSITPSGFVNVNIGENQTFNYQADDGYTITRVLVDNNPVEITGSYTFLNLTTPHTITVLGFDSPSPTSTPIPTIPPITPAPPTPRPPDVIPRITIKPTPKPTVTASPTPAPIQTQNPTVQPTPTQPSITEAPTVDSSNIQNIVIVLAVFVALLAIVSTFIRKTLKKKTEH